MPIPFTIAIRRLRHVRPASLGAILAIAVLGFAALAVVSPTVVLAQAKLPSKTLLDLQSRANALYRAGSYEQAMTAAEAALAQAIREFGPRHEEIAIRTHSLGLIAEAAGRLDAAAAAYGRSVAVREAVYGPDSAGTAQALEQLGRVLLRSGRVQEAETAFARVLAIHSALVGPEHAFTAGARSALGHVEMAKANPEAAIAHYRKAVGLLVADRPAQEQARAVLRDGLRRQRSAFTGLADAAWLVRSIPAANRVGLMNEAFAASQHAWSTAAASALAKMSTRLGAGDTDLGRRIRSLQAVSERILALHDQDMGELRAWSQVQARSKSYQEALQVFRAASNTLNRDNAPVVGQQQALVAELQALMKRCPPAASRPAGCEGSDGRLKEISSRLSELGARSRDAAAPVQLAGQRLQAAEQSLPGAAAFQSRRQARVLEIAQLEQVQTRQRDEIVRVFPDYAALTDPRPLTAVEVQALLRPDEALVSILVGENASYVWAIDKQRATWARIEAGERQLLALVTEVRRGLDPLSADPATGRANTMPSFDVGRAFELYRLVLSPVATVLAGKQHLIVVPTGPLTSLPFQVLVAQKPNPAASPAQQLKNAQWLIRRHGLSVLPSVQSLQALRRLAPESRAPKPFIGIGDPVLQGPPRPSGGTARAASGRGRTLQPLRPETLYRGGSVDLRAVSQLLPLPDTAVELRLVAGVLGASDADLLLRDKARETVVKQAALTDYRIVHFATHGLLAGELSGQAEPALVLTPPTSASYADDGLLTASEVAALRLDADWVVLSACNTAAGDNAGADALSGLARAFFYAGARALMVSHWAVYSEAAVALTTGTFAQMALNPRLGRAEAFRRTMLVMIEKGEPPSVWAPFVIVGEAGAPRAAKPR